MSRRKLISSNDPDGDVPAYTCQTPVNFPSQLVFFRASWARMHLLVCTSRVSKVIATSLDGISCSGQCQLAVCLSCHDLGDGMSNDDTRLLDLLL